MIFSQPLAGPVFGLRSSDSLGNVHPLLWSLAGATHRGGIYPHCQLLFPEGHDLLFLLWGHWGKSRVGQTEGSSGPLPSTNTLYSL